MGRNTPISGCPRANDEVAAESGRSRGGDGAAGPDPNETLGGLGADGSTRTFKQPFTASLDHLVGAGEDRTWDRQAKRPCGLQVVKRRAIETPDRHAKGALTHF